MRRWDYSLLILICLLSDVITDILWVVVAKHQIPKLELYTEMGGIIAMQTWSSLFSVCFLSCRHNQLPDTEACTYSVWATKPMGVTSARLVLASIQEQLEWISPTRRQQSSPGAATNQIQLQLWEWRKEGGREQRGWYVIINLQVKNNQRVVANCIQMALFHFAKVINWSISQ